jgi:hypothetical protein
MGLTAKLAVARHTSHSKDWRTTMSLSQPQQISLFVRWVSASTLGMLAGFVLTYAIVITASVIFEGVNEDQLLSNVVVVALVALTYTAAQLWVLRREIEGSAIWFLASIAGWIVALALAALLGRQGLIVTTTVAGRVLLGILVGLIVGIAQWLPLRKNFQWASFWILGSVIGWAMTMFIIGRSITGIFEMALAGVIPSIFTGLILVILQGRIQIEGKGLVA